MKIIIAGINGYLGKILAEYLVAKGHRITGIDRYITHKIEGVEYVCCDLAKDVGICYEEHDALIDLATMIDFAVDDQRELYVNNVMVAKKLMEYALKSKVKRYIYTSSNSIYLGNDDALLNESVKPKPLDEYGKSKLDTEHFLLEKSSDILVNVIRCPNIIDAGRVGMLSILFELIGADATLWLVGDGSIRHQCIYAQDLCAAIEKLLVYQKTATFNCSSRDLI